jgi:hypothetical protein
MKRRFISLLTGFVAFLAYANPLALPISSPENSESKEKLVVNNFWSTQSRPAGAYVGQGDDFVFLAPAEGDVAWGPNGEVFYFFQNREGLSLVKRDIEDRNEAVVWKLAIDKPRHVEKLLAAGGYIIALMEDKNKPRFERDGVYYDRHSQYLFIIDENGTSKEVSGFESRGSMFSDGDFLYFLTPRCIPKKLNLVTLTIQEHKGSERVLFFVEKSGESSRIMAKNLEGTELLIKSSSDVREDRLKIGMDGTLFGMAWRVKGWGIFQIDPSRKEMKFINSDGLQPLYFDVLRTDRFQTRPRK